MKKLRKNLESMRAEREDAVQESDDMEKRITDLLKQIEEQQEASAAAEARAKEEIEEQQKAAAAAEARAKKVEEENSRLNKAVSTLEDQHEGMLSTIDNMEQELSNQADELTKILTQNPEDNSINSISSKIKIEYQDPDSIHGVFMQNSPESVSLSEISLPSGSIDCLPDILGEQDVASEEEEDEIEITFDSEGNVVFAADDLGGADQRPQRNYIKF